MNPTGLFKGTLITYARDMPSFATYFLVYEVLKNKFCNKDVDLAKSSTSYSKFIGTATAGAAGTCLKWFLDSISYTIRFYNLYV